MKFKKLRHRDPSTSDCRPMTAEKQLLENHLQSLIPIPYERAFSLGMHATVHIPPAIVVHHAAKEALAFQLFQQKVK